MSWTESASISDEEPLELLEERRKTCKALIALHAAELQRWEGLKVKVETAIQMKSLKHQIATTPKPSVAEADLLDHYKKLVDSTGKQIPKPESPPQTEVKTESQDLKPAEAKTPAPAPAAKPAEPAANSPTAKPAEPAAKSPTAKPAEPAKPAESAAKSPTAESAAKSPTAESAKSPAAKPAEPATKSPTAESAKPAEPAAKPAEPAAKSPTAKPVEPAAKPAEPAAKPAEPAAKPAEPAAKPAEPAAKPAEPAAKPAEPAAKPAETTDKPAEPADKPAESAAKPAESAESTNKADPEEPTAKPARSESAAAEVAETKTSESAEEAKAEQGSEPEERLSVSGYDEPTNLGARGNRPKMRGSTSRAPPTMKKEPLVFTPTVVAPSQTEMEEMEKKRAAEEAASPAKVKKVQSVGFNPLLGMKLASGPALKYDKCSECPCIDFSPDTFKKGKCTNCFHIHPVSKDASASAATPASPSATPASPSAAPASPSAAVEEDEEQPPPPTTPFPGILAVAEASGTAASSGDDSGALKLPAAEAGAPASPNAKKMMFGAKGFNLGLAPSEASTEPVVKCKECGCEDFSPDSFKKTKCSNCFHVHTGAPPPPKAGPKPDEVVVEAVTKCKECGCGNFKSDPFKKSKCSNCFHNHV